MLPRSAIIRALSLVRDRTARARAMTGADVSGPLCACALAAREPLYVRACDKGPLRPVLLIGSRLRRFCVFGGVEKELPR